MIYVFDVDGTLTDSRLPIDSDFKVFFLSFISSNTVWLVTGSDKDKTIEQVGSDIWSGVSRVYQSCGNELYIGGDLQYMNTLELPPAYYSDLEFLLSSSAAPVKAGNHIEERVGLVNFSTVGRSCTQDQRDAYYKWDSINQERKSMCEYLNGRYPDYEAVKGGQISIDIYKRGKNKAQILDHIHGEPFVFFGDHLEPGGNDYPVKALSEQRGLEGTFHQVSGWRETMKLLKSA